MMPLVWNRRTGNLVGGHQRLSIMDELEGTKDYFLHVAMVDIDDKTEREQNIFFNNQEAAGDWDMAKLGQMFKGAAKIDNDAAGFDLGQVYGMFGAKALEGNAEGMSILADAVRKSKELTTQIRDKARQRDGFNYYRVLVFKSDDEANAWDMACGVMPEKLYFVDGVKLAKKLNLVLELDESPAPQGQPQTTPTCPPSGSAQ